MDPAEFPGHGRTQPQQTDGLLEDRYARPFEMRGRVMDGWLRVDSEGLQSKRELERWVNRGVKYARSLPPKE